MGTADKFRRCVIQGAVSIWPASIMWIMCGEESRAVAAGEQCDFAAVEVRVVERNATADADAAFAVQPFFALPFATSVFEHVRDAGRVHEAKMTYGISCLKLGSVSISLRGR